MLRDDIRFLGVSGSKNKQESTSSIQVSQNVVIDAGNLLSSLGDESRKIEHIFLTHSHLDHIVDIAFWIDNYYDTLKKPLKIYGLKNTLKALDEHIFNWDIWPNFREIPIKNSDLKSIEFIELEYDVIYKFGDVSLQALALNHTVDTCGFVIKKSSFSALYATDTYITDEIWNILNNDHTIDSLIIDVSFPSSYSSLAKQSKHLTPELLARELKKLNRDNIDLYITHIKSIFYNDVVKELEILGLINGNSRVLKDGEYLKKNEFNVDKNQSVMQISLALSQEKDLGKILEMILNEAINYTNSEGGTIYLKENDKLHFKSVMNKKLNIFMSDPDFPTISIYNESGENKENVSARCVIERRVINIPDVYTYNMDGISFEGVKKFDKANGYRTKSMLVIPMIDQDGEVVGVLQLINKKQVDNLVKYENDDIQMTTTYTNWSASAITKNRLIDSLEELLFSFLESISVALATKSPYGHGHIARVAMLMREVSKKISEDETIFKDKVYTKEELKELEIAAWMHDVGKIATPEYIIDKATKLETIYDRINELEIRFKYVKQSLKIQMLENGEDLSAELNKIDKYFEFIKMINQPDSFLSDEKSLILKEIYEKTYLIDGKEFNLLSEDEYKNLSIKAGTLTKEERAKINEHAQVSNDMLDMLTFPKKYSRVKEIATAHHEKLNGKGYPRGLSGDEISFEGRLLAIIDIFEALTANDRPYKKRKTKQQTFDILYDMADKGEIDKDIVDFINKANLYDEFVEDQKVQLSCVN